MGIKSLLFVGMLTVPFSLQAQQTFGNTLDTLVEARMAERKIPALAVAIIRAGKIDTIKTYGKASIELTVAADADTLFQVASVTKAFTAVAVQMLVAEKKLALDDRLDKFFSDLPLSWGRVTVRQLLQHTSGLPNLSVDQYTMRTFAATWDEALNYLRDKPLEFSPGQQWNYNSTNMMLLDQLIAKISGMSYADFMQAKMFQPLGIQSASFGGVNKVVPNRATHYTWFDFSGDRPRQAEQLQVLDYTLDDIAFAGGGLNISIADFSRWLIALQQEKLISKQQLEALWEPIIFNNGTQHHTPPGAPYSSYGLCWILNSDSDPVWVGGTGGLRSAFAIYPEHALAIAVLTNLQGAGPEAIVTEIGKLFLDAAK